MGEIRRMKTTPAEFAAALHVSRETMTRLNRYAELLARWQKSINLISPATVNDLWRRHFMDSAQLAQYLPAQPIRMADFGSGAGFPGLVLAAMRPDNDVHLLESDQRKSVFLREAARLMEVKVTVHNSRIGETASVGADLITARALAPLDELLDMAMFHVKPDGTALFLKGKETQAEIDTAKEAFEFEHELHPSLTSPEGAIVALRQLKRRA